MSDDTAIAIQLGQTLAGLVAFGCVLIAATRLRRKPDATPDAPAKPGAPLWIRLGTLLVLAVCLFIPAFLGLKAWTAVVLVIVALGLAEFWGMLSAIGAQPHRKIGYAAGLLLPVLAAQQAVGSLHLALILGLLMTCTVALFAESDVPLPTRLGGTVLGVLYVGFFGAHFVLIHHLAGFGGVVWFLMVVQLADVGGLMGGTFFGRHKMAPRLSPGKTWEGTATGLIAAAGAGLGFSFALPARSLGVLVGIALALAVAGIIGDLLASGFKRAAGLKDFGRALPGHGGVLDRFDGYLFAAPVCWLLLSLL